MSAFLGHIHYWLYKKIQLLCEREALILEKTRFVIDDLADELHQISVDQYGAPIDSTKPLEDLIDHNNIHGWLQNKITVASVREASFIKDLLDTTTGDEGLQTIAAVLDAFAMHGRACGTVGKDSLAEINSTEIYNVLQNFYVNGMPCDGGDQIIENNPVLVQWVGDHRLQTNYWRTAGVDPDFMMLAYQTWFEFFVAAIDDNYEFIVTKDNDQRIYTIKHK